MESAKKRKETYEKMGLKVIQVTLYNVFSQTKDGWRKRPDFEDNLLEAIAYAEDKGKSLILKKGNLETNVVEDYKYKSGKKAA